MKRSCNRRDFFQISVKLAGICIFAACVPKSNTAEEAVNQNSPVDPCEDFSNVKPSDLQLREAFGYVKQSPIIESQCKNCNLWKPPAKGLACGGCTLFKGPVYDDAYCTYWAPVV